MLNFMDSIAQLGIALGYHCVISKEKREFLSKYVEAQMVSI